MGVLIGPDSFAERIASAKSGEVIPIDFALHTWVAVLVCCSLPWCPCSSRPCWRPDVALRGPDAQRRRPGLH
ncbi:hypothetical membrane spanning protein [Cutibacterium acnes JCM 18916]|nr:hypothetical membrane spanning protein [Cutibacterium acnes JCM 18916]